MSTNALQRRKPIGRTEYKHIGVDSTGAHHVHRWRDDTVFVIDPAAREVEHREALGAIDREKHDWIQFVADRRGWDRRMICAREVFGQ